MPSRSGRLILFYVTDTLYDNPIKLLNSGAVLMNILTKSTNFSTSRQSQQYYNLNTTERLLHGTFQNDNTKTVLCS